MNYNLETIIAEAKKSKANLIALKHLTVKLGLYDLASDIRALEKELYPESEEVKNIKIKASKLTGIFAMCGIKVNNQTSYILDESIRLFNEKQGDFSIDDAVKIQVDSENIFTPPNE